MTDERAYLTGWSASMAGQGREPPPELDEHELEIWLEGWRDALDSQLGSAPDIADLMRAGVL